MNHVDFTQMMQQARTKPILNYLDKIGIKPAWSSNNNFWYVSPIRPGEKTPSFKVNLTINKWFDFGSGSKGDIIDLVMKLENINIFQAVKSIEKTPSCSSLSFGGNISKKTDLELLKIKPLHNKALIQYLETRCISFCIGKEYLKEAYYRINGKNYFSLAFQNSKNGYELRNKYFKGSISPKYYTIIKANEKTLNLFEGPYDFLSALVFYKVDKLDNTSIILNSLSFLDRIIPLLLNYEYINIFFDNDNSGIEAVKKLKQLHKKAIDYSKIIYPGHKDFNQFIINNHINK